MSIQPYLFFNGRCEEAIALYQRVLGAETIMLMRHRDNPEPPPEGTLPPGLADKVMHAAIKIGDATVLLSDGNGDLSAPHSQPRVSWTDSMKSRASFSSDLSLTRATCRRSSLAKPGRVTSGTQHCTARSPMARRRPR
jgi:uncharacterized glyoxalase superfamily protein PhnB